MKTAVVFASLVSAAFAAQVKHVPASQFTVTTPDCTGTRVTNAIAAGRYAALPQASAAANQGGCGGYVFYVNEEDGSTDYYATIVKYTDSDVIELSPTSFQEAAGGKDSFTASYTVSPLVG